MIVSLLLIFLFGYVVGMAEIMGRVKKHDANVHKKINIDLKCRWNSFVDGFRSKTNEEKVEKLQDEIAELEGEE